MQIDNQRLGELIEFYKSSFREHWEDEKYKWIAVKWFQEHFDINANVFSEMFKESIRKTVNLLASVNNFPGAQIVNFAEEYENETRTMFRNLFDETLDLQTRIDSFKQKSSEIVANHNNANPNNLWEQSYQKENAISTYLWLRFPDKYYIYKYNVYKAVAEKTGAQIKFTKGVKENIVNGFALYNEICNQISTDVQIKELLKDVLTDDCYLDKNLKTLTIDFGFHVSRYYNAYLQSQKTMKYWLYAPGENAKYWDEFYQNNIMGIGWEELGNLSNYSDKEQLKVAMINEYGSQDSDKAYMNFVACTWNFANEMNVGDIVFVKQGKTKILGYGIVKSNYYYDSNRKIYPNIRSVEWKAKGIWEHPGDAVLKTLTDITPYTQYVEKLKALFNMQTNPYQKFVDLLNVNHNLILTSAPGTGKTYLAKQIAKQMIFGENKEKLTNEEQILLNERCHFVQFHPSYDYTDFVEGLRPINNKGNVGFERKDGAFKDFCKIALSYNTKIEDIEGRVVKNQSMVDEKIETIKLRILNFLEKNKSTEYEYNNGMILYRFDRQVGDDLIFSARWKNPASRLPQNIVTINMPIFIKYVLFDINLQDELPENHKDYIENKYVWAYYENFENEIMLDDEINQLIYETRDLIESRKCVFIIDEINRGEISKIFGELFFSIDPGYRGKNGRVQTQYQNLVDDEDEFKHGFFIPENVYIIGTMNDIDRSVESMDFAMRRRFAWKEVSADDSMQMLDGMANANEMKARMTSLNNAILAIKELGKAYQIGAAYFKKYELYNDFNKLWEYHLEGVLREYLRGNPNAEEQLKELKKAYDIESATDGSDDTNE